MAACLGVALGSAAATAATTHAAHERQEQFKAARAGTQPVHDDNREEWAASRIQAHYRGHQARCMARVARQAHMVNKAATKLKRLPPLQGKLLQGGFPGAPVNASMQCALEYNDNANCYEASRDAVLRFFVRYNTAFTYFGLFLMICFVINIFVLIVFFWGAVFGVGVFDPNAACDVNTSDPMVSYEGNVQYPPKVYTSASCITAGCPSEYVAQFCNLNQYVFNINIKACQPAPPCPALPQHPSTPQPVCSRGRHRPSKLRQPPPDTRVQNSPVPADQLRLVPLR